MNTTAPTFTSSDTSFATLVSCSGVMFVFTNSRCTLRVYRLAAAIDMIAAGTSAPMPIAANATPTNHDGKKCRNSAGTAKFEPYALKYGANSGMSFTPDASAM